MEYIEGLLRIIPVDSNDPFPLPQPQLHVAADPYFGTENQYALFQPTIRYNLT